MVYKKLTSVGNSWGLVIPKALLDALNINPVINEATIEIKDEGLFIKKCKEDDK